MMAFILIMHTLICIFLVAVILMQSGRGGGLTAGLSSSAESMLGAQTNVFMTRATTVLSVLFLTTCLTLAFMSSKRESSLMTSRPFAPADASAPAVDVTPENLPEAVPEPVQP